MPLLLRLGIPLVIFGGIGFGAWKHNENKKIERQPAPEQQVVQQKVQVTTGLQVGSTNDDLSKDLETIDANLKATETSSVDIDAGLNDKSTL